MQQQLALVLGRRTWTAFFRILLPRYDAQFTRDQWAPKAKKALGSIGTAISQRSKTFGDVYQELIIRAARAKTETVKIPEGSKYLEPIYRAVEDAAVAFSRRQQRTLREDLYGTQAELLDRALENSKFSVPNYTASPTLDWARLLLLHQTAQTMLADSLALRQAAFGHKAKTDSAGKPFA